MPAEERIFLQNLGIRRDADGERDRSKRSYRFHVSIAYGKREYNRDNLTRLTPPPK